MQFKGLAPEILPFLKGLELNNSRAYWQNNNSTWRNIIRPSVLSLCRELAPFFGAIRMYRPNRDTRFGKNVEPYKTWVGITTKTTALGSNGYFFSIDTEEIKFTAGVSAFSPSQIQRYRLQLDNETASRKLLSALDEANRGGFEVSSGRKPRLKRTPRGFEDSHKNAELLKSRGLVVVQTFPLTDLIFSEDLGSLTIDLWGKGTPLVDWIHEYVGLP